MLGGLALFLFGLHALGSGLQEMAGRKAQKVLEVLTSVPVVGMGVGALVTMVVQSSTLVTVMVVSLVNSTMLNLKQAASVIMGANIGTTLTAQLVAFRITDVWVYAAFLGFAVFFFAKKKNIKTIGYSVFAFAMLLLGLYLMTEAMRPLRGNPAFEAMIVTFGDNRMLALLVGLVFTAIVNSSTAVTSVVVAMTIPDPETRESLISLSVALPIILGANVGTCFTAVLASVGGSVGAKRAAAVHVIFNAVGAFIFLIFLNQFEWAVLAVSPEGDVPRQAANAHTMFSVITTILFLPLINQLVKLVTFLLPERNEKDAPTKDTIYLDWKMINNPNVAIKLAEQELLRMAGFAGENVTLAIEGFINKKKKKLRQLKRQERLVDKLEKEIVRFLAAAAQTSMGKHVSTRHAGLLHAANDIERISDHAINIARIAKNVMESEIDFPRQAMDEIEDMYKPVAEIYETALKSVKEDDKTLYPRVKELEALIDIKKKEMRNAHITRMSEGNFSAECGILYLEILSDLERISDHSVNVSHLSQGKL